MKQRRRNYNASFKAKVVLEMLKGAATGCELACKYVVHPTLMKVLHVKTIYVELAYTCSFCLTL